MIGVRERNPPGHKTVWFMTSGISLASMLVFAVVVWPRGAPLEDKLAAIEPISKSRDLSHRGFVKHRRGRVVRAMADYTAALELNPDLPHTYFRRGTARFERKDYAGAVEDFTSAIEGMAEPVREYNSRGAAREALGDLDGAVEDLSRAIELEPDFARALVNRGKVRQRLGDYEGALADLDRAVELRPAFPWVWDSRGVARFEQGDLAGALEDFDQAAALAEERPYSNAFRNRAAVRRMQGDRTGAAADLARSQEMERLQAERLKRLQQAWGRRRANKERKERG